MSAITSFDIVVAATPDQEVTVDSVVLHVTDGAPQGDLLAGVDGPSSPEELDEMLDQMDATELPYVKVLKVQQQRAYYVVYPQRVRAGWLSDLTGPTADDLRAEALIEREALRSL